MGSACETRLRQQRRARSCGRLAFSVCSTESSMRFGSARKGLANLLRGVRSSMKMALPSPCFLCAHFLKPHSGPISLPYTSTPIGPSGNSPACHPRQLMLSLSYFTVLTTLGGAQQRRPTSRRVCVLALLHRCSQAYYMCWRGSLQPSSAWRGVDARGAH